MLDRRTFLTSTSAVVAAAVLPARLLSAPRWVCPGNHLARTAWQALAELESRVADRVGAATLGYGAADSLDATLQGLLPTSYTLTGRRPAIKEPWNR